MCRQGNRRLSVGTLNPALRSPVVHIRFEKHNQAISNWMCPYSAVLLWEQPYHRCRRSAAARVRCRGTSAIIGDILRHYHLLPIDLNPSKFVCRMKKISKSKRTVLTIDRSQESM